MSKNSDAVKRWRERVKTRLIEAMGGRCVCCNYNRCARALEFHHRNPEDKDFGVGYILAHIVSWSKIVEEVKKCVMVCGNCHAEIHDGIRSVPDDAPGFNPDYDEYRKEKIVEFEPCPVCGKPKPKYLVTCSRECGSSKSWSVDWGKIDLEKRLENQSMRCLADDLGISVCAISKRLKKLRKLGVVPK